MIILGDEGFIILRLLKFFLAGFVLLLSSYIAYITKNLYIALFLYAIIVVIFIYIYLQYRKCRKEQLRETFRIRFMKELEKRNIKYHQIYSETLSFFLGSATGSIISAFIVFL